MGFRVSGVGCPFRERMIGRVVGRRLKIPLWFSEKKGFRVEGLGFSPLNGILLDAPPSWIIVYRGHYHPYKELLV